MTTFFKLQTRGGNGSRVTHRRRKKTPPCSITGRGVGRGIWSFDLIPFLMSVGKQWNELVMRWPMTV
ncbi:unnamed protein product [Citrullus colocynthis]|uniref:Uncharacterized protein n=1 Tax=Citrullus colocynthis TaxID=252529 RepID=A0ABP0XQ98_9ROSI